jgi:ribosomal-protein-alanine N-acetyltransferase
VDVTPPFDFEAFPRLETPRLALRAMRADDAPALLACLGDPEVVRYLDMEPLADLAQARRMVERWEARFASKERFRWAIAPREGDALIGTGGFVRWSREWAVAELGYDLARAYWGRGLMAEALGAMLGFGFARMGLHRVEAEVMPENRASARLLERLGFRCEGTLRGRGFWKGSHHNLALFALLRDEWTPAG